MQLIYSDDPALKTPESNSIFLAGPTPRSSDVPSWRPEFLHKLEILKFDGIVCIPEYSHGFAGTDVDYLAQVNWERKCLYFSHVILFWVPRSLTDMPAFTTNIEFGYWMAKDPKKVCYGRPNDAVKNDYLDWLYSVETDREPCTTAEDLLTQTLSLLSFPLELSPGWIAQL